MPAQNRHCSAFLLLILDRFSGESKNDVENMKCVRDTEIKIERWRDKKRGD